MLLRTVRHALAVLSAAAALALPMAAQAGPYSSIYVFGDSLSDTGINRPLLSSIGSAPPFPFNTGAYAYPRFSNGPVWVEHVAAALGRPNDAKPFGPFGGPTPGNNYAIAGAPVVGNVFPGVGELPSLTAQAFAMYGLALGQPADPNALYIVVGGGNDMRDARSAPGADAASLELAAQQTADGLADIIGALAGAGAKHVLISTLPDLGLTPEAMLQELMGGPSRAFSSLSSSKFNALVPDLMTLGLGLGLDMNLLDMAGLANKVLANPQNYGISNITMPCTGFAFAGGFGPGSLQDPFNMNGGTSCDQSVYSDILHPSARMHEVIAYAALLAVPEPETLALFAVALLGVFASRRRLAKSAAESAAQAV
jgi:outer membrane lipase/esterase